MYIFLRQKVLPFDTCGDRQDQLESRYITLRGLSFCCQLEKIKEIDERRQMSECADCCCQINWPTDVCLRVCDISRKSETLRK